MLIQRIGRRFLLGWVLLDVSGKLYLIRGAEPKGCAPRPFRVFLLDTYRVWRLYGERPGPAITLSRTFALWSGWCQKGMNCCSLMSPAALIIARHPGVH